MIVEGWQSTGDPERFFNLPPEQQHLLLSARSRCAWQRAHDDPHATQADRLRAKLAMGDL